MLPMNEIIWHNRARKQIKRIPKQYREPIHDCVDQLVTFPECERLDITELKESPIWLPSKGGSLPSAIRLYQRHQNHQNPRGEKKR